MRKVDLLAMFCFLLTGAHFLRVGNMTAVVLCALFSLFSFFKVGWMKRSVIFMLFACLVLWGVETVRLSGLRLDAGAPWLRPACIMAGVTGLHALAVFLISQGQSCLPAGQRARSLVFSVSLLFLLAIDMFVPFPLLLGQRLVSWPAANGVLIAALAWWGGFCAEGLADPAVSHKRRLWMWGVFSFSFFIQFALGLSLLPSLLMTGKLHIPAPFMMVSGPLYRGEGVFMIILFSVSVLLVGAAWCSHLCYFGVWDGLAASSAGKKLTPLTGKAARDWRWLALVLAAAVPVMLAWFGVPLPVAAGLAMAALLAAPLLWKYSSRRGTRMYCGYICPMGLVARLIGRLSPWRVAIQEDKCSGCRKCASVCSDQAIHVRDGKCFVNSRCTLCRDCLPQCSHGALDLRFRLPGARHAPKADLAFIVIVSLVNVIFLATARI